MKILLLLFLSAAALFSQAAKIEVQTFIRYVGRWRSDNGVPWRSGAILYLTPDGFWLRLNGGIFRDGTKLVFNYREGHSQDLGTWRLAVDAKSIEARAKRYMMGSEELGGEDLKEEWTRNRVGGQNEELVVKVGNRKVRMRMLYGQTPDRRVFAALESERERAKLKP